MVKKTMKNMLFLFTGLCVGTSFLLTGCEWTSGGGVDSWDSSMNFVDVSGVYRANDGQILVREFADSSVTNHVTETIGSSDGACHTCMYNLKSPPVPGTLLIKVGAYVFTDTPQGTNSISNGTLAVNQSDGTTGTVNYDTAIVTLSFPSPLSAGAQITADYLSLHQSTGQGNHGSAIYTFTVFQQGDNLTIVDSNGTTYEGRLGSVRTTGGRPNEEVATSDDGVILGPGDTTSSLSDGPVVAQFSATSVSQGYEVTLVGVFEGTLNGASFTERIVSGTYMERGGYQADFHGTSD